MHYPHPYLNWVGVIEKKRLSDIHRIGHANLLVIVVFLCSLVHMHMEY